MTSESGNKKSQHKKPKTIYEDYDYFGGDKGLDEAEGEFKEQSNLSLCAMLGIDVGKIAL